MSDFEKKTLPNGEKNPKYVDLCDEDPPIAGQKFACMSFVSPEKILMKREVYLFNQFIKQWEFSKSMERYFEFIHFIAYKHNIDVEKLIEDFNEFVKEESTKLKKSGIEDDYKNFMDKQEDKLNEQFSRDHSFQTSVRGLKLRGVFPSQDEAELKCKKLRESDTSHDIFVAPVGVWLPWDPDAYKTGRVEHLEEELNALHHEKLKNEEKAKKEFEERVRESKKQAIMENIEKAKKTGNTLTQTIDEEGNLTGVKENVDFDSREATTIESTKIRNELFVKETLEKQKASENIEITVTDKDVTRFFMTVNEAVALVLNATLEQYRASACLRGCVSVLNMGASIKIDILAKQMIKLAGFIPNKQIKIVYTGLTKGEKLHESLYSKAEQKVEIGEKGFFLVKSKLSNRQDLIKKLDSLKNSYNYSNTTIKRHLLKLIK